MQTLTELEGVRQSIKRWRSRAKRAQTALDKLYRKEARLMKPDQAITPKVKPEKPTIEKVKPPVPEISDGLDIPKEFVRKPQGTPEERQAMPLNDRDAMKFIKAQSAKVTAKRAKRDRPFMK